MDRICKTGQEILCLPKSRSAFQGLFCRSNRMTYNQLLKAPLSDSLQRMPTFGIRKSIVGRSGRTAFDSQTIPVT